MRRRHLTERHLDKEYLALSFLRMVSAALAGERLIPLSEVMERAEITQEQLDHMPDVEIDCGAPLIQRTPRRSKRGGSRRRRRYAATRRGCTFGNRLVRKRLRT